MSELFNYLEHAWQSLITSWLVKIVFAAIGGMAIYLIGIKHVQILGVFILLVVIDLFTKWAAVAWQMLIDMGGNPENLTLWDKYVAIPVAFEKGLIKSRYMREGFVQKIITYVLATTAAYFFDTMIVDYSFAVNLTWLYLGSSEFISILENMRDGGNENMGKFLELVRNKIENKVKV